MKILVIVLMIFGIAEILSNLFHLLKGPRDKIAESARKQHQELPLDAGLQHFFYKAVLMFLIGVLFLTSSLVYFIYDNNFGITFTLINSIIMSLYGFVQILIYYRTIKVWTSFIVYSIPLIAYLIIL